MNAAASASVPIDALDLCAVHDSGTIQPVKRRCWKPGFENAQGAIGEVLLTVFQIDAGIVPFGPQKGNCIVGHQDRR